MDRRFKSWSNSVAHFDCHIWQYFLLVRIENKTALSNLFSTFFYYKMPHLVALPAQFLLPLCMISLLPFYFPPPSSSSLPPSTPPPLFLLFVLSSLLLLLLLLLSSPPSSEFSPPGNLWRQLWHIIGALAWPDRRYSCHPSRGSQRRRTLLQRTSFFRNKIIFSFRAEGEEEEEEEKRMC